ncbi:MAG: siroheme synthase CysG [Pseudomonadota bacterium]
MSRKPRKARPPRMGELSRLPVFMNLHGKRVLVAGGTDAAAWKAELLLASGAHVALYAHGDLEDDMIALLSDPAYQDRLEHHQRPWSLDSFALTAFAIADANNDDEARAFACAAREAGVAYNVIDRPRFCQLQFGSIVNRSPVVIGISSSGAAPILGQTIRRKIETLLPISLTAWAKAAERIRSSVMNRLPAGPKRRAVWERFAELSFQAPADVANTFEGSDLIEQAANDHVQGKVTIVGAGPGDPELLTMKAIRSLQAADIILFDDLVSEEVLELARREARRMMVGKRGGKASCRQDDINDLMIKLAKQGKHVVRLKSGDPMVFGRTGEELAALRNNDIPVTVVPGVTAASALASNAKVSLTHRDHAQTVSLATGHAKNGELPTTLDLNAISRGGSSHVVYMGGRTAEALQSELLAKGASGSMPVLVAKSVSRPEETLLLTTLANFVDDSDTLLGDGPILIGLGDAFGLADIEQSQSMPSPATPERAAGGSAL